MTGAWSGNSGSASIPLTTVETAFLLASLRRAARRPDAIPLGPIRSLHYFLPVIEELLRTRPPSERRLSCLPTQQNYSAPGYSRLLAPAGKGAKVSGCVGSSSDNACPVRNRPPCRLNRRG